MPKTHLKFIANPVSTSVRVSVSIECTPGDTAKKSILTLWHDEGRSGLHVHKNQQFSESSPSNHLPNPHPTIHSQNPRIPHLPRQSTAHHTSPPLLLLHPLPPSSLPRTGHLQPPRPPTLVKHKNIQREHIQRVYLPRPQRRTNNAAPLPIPILSTPSKFQREQTVRNNDILPARYSALQFIQHPLLIECTGDVWARCTRSLARCTPLSANLDAWADICLCL